MNLEMVPIEIVGLKTNLQPVVQTLRRLGCMHIEELNGVPEIAARPLVLDPLMLRRYEELALLGAQIGGLLGVLGGAEPKTAILPSENYFK